jgi:hypothetical protein
MPLAPKNGDGTTPAVPGSRKVKAAIDAMVWKGLSRKEAAEAAGLQEHSLYQALRLPLTLHYLNEQMKVLRRSERSKSVHTIIELRDTSNSDKVKLEAAKMLMDEEGTEALGSAVIRHAGVTIVIESAKDVGSLAGTGQVIEHIPSDINELDE